MNEIVYNASLLGVVTGLIALAVAWSLREWISNHPIGVSIPEKTHDRILHNAKLIKDGASTFLNREYKIVAKVSGVILIILCLLGTSGIFLAGGFLVGAFLSALAGASGMSTNVHANYRVTLAAYVGLPYAFKMAFRGGAVTGIMVSSLGLLCVSTTLLIIWRFAPEYIPATLIGLSFGGSLMSIFARIGGGIFTKGADVGADLAGKSIAGLPEDDPRNPAVIADNVGDNVGDCAGMAADLFETYVVTFSATILLTMTLLGENSPWVAAPLLIGIIANISFISIVFFVRLFGKKKGIMSSLYGVIIANIAIAYTGTFFIFDWFTSFSGTSGVFNLYQIMATSGIAFLVTCLLVGITDYYTSHNYKPVKKIASASHGGEHALNILAGHSVGSQSVVPTILVIISAIIVSYMIGGGFSGQENLGLLAIAFTSSAMLSMAGVIVAIDAFGPIVDNAGGIAEMSQVEEKRVRNITDELDAVGNTTKAVTKGYAIGSAGLAALVLFAEYTKSFSDLNISLDNPLVLAGLLLSSVVYLFSGWLIDTVREVAQTIVKEIERQFKNPDVMKGKKEPDYEKTIDIATKASIFGMIKPALLPVVVPILTWFILGPEAVAGLLIGSIILGIPLALYMTISGGAWDNSKKHVEDGNHGGKGSDAHKAVITGDTVGDPFKDTAGPAINPYIKIINLVPLILVTVMAFG